MKARKKQHEKKIRARQKKQVSRKVRIKRAVKRAVKTIWKHLVELPEREREQNLATIGRMVKKRLKWGKGEHRKSKLENR